MGIFSNLFNLGGAGPGGAGPTSTGTAGPSWLNRNSDVLLSMGLGALGGRNAQEQQAGMVGGLVQGMRANKTAKYLQEKDPELAEAVRNGMLDMSDAFKLSYQRKADELKAQRPSRKFQTLPDGTYGFADENAGTFTPTGRAAKEEKDNRPSLIQEFEYARQDGFKGSIADYSRAKTAAGGVGGGYKAPTGYRAIDPNNPEAGLEPIPGGPAEEIPGELAARLGMSKSFLERAPDLRKKLAAGALTGPWDQRFALNGWGERGQLYQEMQSGTDALMRLLTGAGMNATEAEAYAQRYLPTGSDTAETAVAKLDRLARELEATAIEAGKGRGGFSVQPRQAQRRRFNPATGELE